MARKQMVSPPEEGAEAPEFNLPGAQGGQLRLGLRTARGPVIVVFYRGAWSGECVDYFKALAERDREINVAGATLVGIGAVEPEEAREFVRETGFKSYVLYDYVRRTTSEYGLLQKDPEHGDAARPAVFLIGNDHKVIRAWLDERPPPEDLLAEVSKITGLPKEPEEGEAEEKPKKRPRKAAEGETTDSETAEPGAGDIESSAAKGSSGGAEPSAGGDAESSDSGEEPVSSEGDTQKAPGARKEGTAGEAEPEAEGESSGEPAGETPESEAAPRQGGEEEDASHEYEGR